MWDGSGKAIQKQRSLPAAKGQREKFFIKSADNTARKIPDGERKQVKNGQPRKTEHRRKIQKGFGKTSVRHETETGNRKKFSAERKRGARAERKRDSKATFERQRCQKTRKNFGYEKREDAKKQLILKISRQSGVFARWK